MGTVAALDDRLFRTRTVLRAPCDTEPCERRPGGVQGEMTIVSVSGSTMNLRHIEVFHAVYQSGSVSAASRALNVSQPSVSKVLHHTQQQLGFDLFKLVRGRLVATDEAHALFVEVKDINDRLLSLQKAVRNIRDIGGGHIRLAMVPSLGQHVLPAALTAYRCQHPESPSR